MWFWLPFLTSGTAAADEGLAGVDLVGGYRRTEMQTPWAPLREQRIDESLEAMLDHFLVARAIAAYTLGFAIDRTDIVEPGRSRTDSLRYNTRLRLNEQGLTPVQLFADRSTTGISNYLGPGERAVQNTAGFQAGLAPYRLPRVTLRGMRQRSQSEVSTGLITDALRRNIGGDVVHLDDRLSVSGRVVGLQEAYETQVPVSDDITSQSASWAADVMGSYMHPGDYQISTHTQSRSMRTMVEGQEVVLNTTRSEGRYMPQSTRNVKTTGFYTLDRATGLDFRAGALSAGSDTILIADRAAGNVAFGLTDAWTEGEEGLAGAFGQYGRVQGGYRFGGRRGSIEPGVQGGLASVISRTDPWGAQASGGAGLGVTRSFGANVLQLGGVGRLSTQTDTSERNQDLIARDWLAQASTAAYRGWSLRLQAEEHVIEFTEQEEGDSDRLSIGEFVSLRPRQPFQVEYGTTLYRDVLDEEFVSGFGHTAAGSVTPIDRVHVRLRYTYEAASSNLLDPMWTEVADASVTWDPGALAVTTRATRTRQGGRVPDTQYSLLWLEVRRGFRWLL